MAQRLTLADLNIVERRLICNGAGPKGWGWLVPEFAFHEAADQHDLDYWQGNLPPDKVLADWRFFNGCLAGAWKRNGRRCVVLILLSLIYFVAVALGGWLCFHWGRRRRGKTELFWAVQDAQARKHLGG